MKYTKMVYWIMIYCILFSALQYVYRYHFYYIEQLQLFRFGWQYASDTILQPGGLSLYVARFLVQFYALPAAGALVTAFLLMSASMLVHRLTEKCHPPRIGFLLCLLPACFLFFLHTDMNYNIQGTVAYLIMLVMINGYVRINAFGKRLAAGLILVPVLFLLAGATVSLFALFVTVWEFIHTDSRRYLTLILPAEAVLIGLTALYLNREGELRAILMPDAYYERLLENSIVYYAWLALPVSYLASFLFGKYKSPATPKPKPVPSSFKREAVMTALLLFPFLLTVAWTVKNDKRLILKTVEQDYYLRNCWWDKIIETFPPERYSLQMMNVMNHALAQKNLLGERLFDYNPQGARSILAEWDDTHVNAIALSDIYYHIGDVAVAQKLAFEGAVSSLNDGNVRLLQRLIETNIIFREYPVAEKYIRLLEQTLLYREKAQYYRTFLYNDAAVGNDPALGSKRKALIKNNVYAAPSNRTRTFERLAENHAENPLPMQYLLAVCLADKDLKTFRALLDKHFRTAALPALSTGHQEAVIALEQDNPGFWIKNGVSTGVEKKFRAFDADMIQNRRLPDFKEKMQRSHGNTYWYYLLFNDIKTTRSAAAGDVYSNDSYSCASILVGGGGGRISL
ncbi:MAG: DUF6057 family protein [Tannerella sp.]|jgi:hypothetical protein|nr:DUF6057 family protein [Tannerella sp.]